MIDSFWTKWRIKQLAGGEALLAGKWLEDYARWLYGRAWYRCRGDQAQVQRLLEETFAAAAGRLKECAAGKFPMSDWLVSMYEPFAAGFPVPDPAPQPTEELRKAVGGLFISPMSETESFWPELIRFSQQALAMLSCDEQCLLVCRYFRLERPADTAAQYGMSLSELQTSLYRASHSFRRILETLTQHGVQDTPQRGQLDSAILETNLEKIFRTLVLESPTLEFMAQLKERVEAVLSQNNSTGWSDSKKKKVYLGTSIAVLCTMIMIFIWCGNHGSLATNDEMKTSQNTKLRTQKDVSPAAAPDAAQEVQLAVRLGMAQDMEGLLGILRTGTYPAQIAAAYYLGQYGDPSAINLLDQAAQKWYTEDSTGTNPFIEAIAAIENRMRLQARQELQAKVQSLLTRKPSVPETPLPLYETRIPREPNILLKQDAAKPQSPILPEPNAAPQKPNDTEPLLIVRMEPNKPPSIEEVNEPVYEESNG
jgi:DNA-directed RNA polymerase specialized sigma24 family protein